MLHIISVGTGHSVLLERLGSDDALLFIGEAVLSLHKNAHHAEPLLQSCHAGHCYALAPDLHLRGLSALDVLPQIILLEYVDFVQLTLEHTVIKTWR